MEYMKMHRIPFLLNADGGFAKQDRKPVYLLKRHLIGMASAWLSTGKLTDEYLMHYGASKARIFRYPFSSVREKDCYLPTEEERRQKKQELGIKEELAVISVGQFIPRKGMDLLMKCASGLPENVGIYLIGGEPKEDYLALQEKLGANKIHFVGFQEKGKLREYYIAADVFAFPTREDIWGLVLQEAMAFGLPCVASDRAIASHELIKDGTNGYMTDPKNTEEMTEKLNALLSDSEKRSCMGRAAYETAKSYTIETMAKRHMEILEQLVLREKEIVQ
jgi:glycosyltransferase involved in cell wall biosynthesis